MSVIKARKTPEDNAFWDHVEAIARQVRESRNMHISDEAFVRAKWPDACCNTVLFRGLVRYKICVGTYEQQRSLSRAKGMQHWAWHDAAERIKSAGRKGMR